MATATRTVTAAGWRDAVGAALAGGWRFAGLYAREGAPGPAIRAVLTRGAERQVLGCRSGGRSVASIADLVPAAVWDEREAHDLYGWSFPGHEPLRALADHRVPTDRWTVALSGRDAHQVAVGPIHAGIIESGHFRFSAVGERVLHLDLRLFYKHRGLQVAAEGHRGEAAIAYAQRACAADAVTNGVAYAQACEAALGYGPAAGIGRARTLLLELERLYNHLNDIAAICAGVGFAPGNMLFAALKEQAQRLNARLTGHRFLFGAVQVGASALAIDGVAARAARRDLDDLRAAFTRARREVTFAGSLQERLERVGITTREQVSVLGGVGPVARAAGVAADVRSHSPGLDYPDFTPAAPREPTGDVAARFELRATELDASFELLDRLLGERLAAVTGERGAGPAPTDAVGTAIVESPRGQTLCAVEPDGEGRVARLHLRTGSYANWPLLALAARGALLTDFPLINKSFELCYACVDR